MECRDFQEKLFDYLEDTLSQKERADIDEHLSDCEICQSELKERKAFLEIESLVPKFEPSPSMDEKLFKKIEEYEKASKFNFSEWLKSLFSPKLQWSAGLATAAIILAVSIIYYQTISIDKPGHPYTAFTSIPKTVIETSLKEKSDKMALGFTQASHSSLFFFYGQKGIETAALIASKANDTALDRMEIMIEHLKGIQEFHGILDDLAALKTAVSKNLEQDSWLTRLSKINHNLEKKAQKQDETAFALYNLGAFLIKLKIFADANSAQSLQSLKPELNDLLVQLKKIEFHPKGITLVNDIQNILSRENITPADFKTITDNAKILQEIVSSGAFEM